MAPSINKSLRRSPVRKKITNEALTANKTVEQQNINFENSLKLAPIKIKQPATIDD